MNERIRDESDDIADILTGTCSVCLRNPSTCKGCLRDGASRWYSFKPLENGFEAQIWRCIACGFETNHVGENARHLDMAPKGTVTARRGKGYVGS